MNRRDIIIVAVLINAGLLVTLFVSSLKKGGELELAGEQKAPEEIVIAPTKAKDPIDQVISQYTAKAKVEEAKKALLPAPVLAPAPKEEKKVVPKSPLRIVTVQKGDVLEKIARTHGVSVDAIMKLNRLTNSRLQIGQELKLPPKRPAVKKEAVDGKKYYVVKGGDSPWTIAQKNGLKVEELLRLNNLDEEKAKKLRPGDRLKIQ
ncbi:LysM peptidoglycan-binding domain-containing protein [Candidatus Neptunochlamydia vexilliferae]|uniref:LysM domain-containing protein n=1 Tax=Candidatus Neptunichlamydia vexilliferae TaxID=1651774 RepID=A0ABS0AX14_9BACT|nr:LysM peptidoglycan-binding domain-containing protein [Candidatus Neptunochlamydia vexilliferae]MBF5058509.1 hypothetical protein [Candidatus Neptunochlamydia vexilliferae]